MLHKATKAAFALKSMLDNTASATLINTLFAQLIKPILLYGVEQWLPYIHPRKVAQSGPTETYASLTTQLDTEQIWKDMVYAHYSLHTSTPILATSAELGAYMSYLCGPTAPPLISKALLVQRAIARSSKFSWWNNTWRILASVNITPDNISNPPTDIKGPVTQAQMHGLRTVREQIPTLTCFTYFVRLSSVDRHCTRWQVLNGSKLCFAYTLT